MDINKIGHALSLFVRGDGSQIAASLEKMDDHELEELSRKAKVPKVDFKAWPGEYRRAYYEFFRG